MPTYRNHSLHTKMEPLLGSKILYFYNNMYYSSFPFSFLSLQFIFTKNYIFYRPSKHLPYSLYPLRFIMNLGRKHLAVVIIICHYLLCGFLYFITLNITGIKVLVAVLSRNIYFHGFSAQF